MKQVKLIKSYQSNELEEKINIAIQENGLANIHDIKINMAIDEDNDAVYLAAIIYEEDLGELVEKYNEALEAIDLTTWRNAEDEQEKV